MGCSSWPGVQGQGGSGKYAYMGPWATVYTVLRTEYSTTEDTVRRSGWQTGAADWQVRADAESEMGITCYSVVPSPQYPSNRDTPVLRTQYPYQ